MASVKNLASGTLVSGINVGDTTLLVAVGSGTSEQLLAVWPTPPFYITVAPDSPASGVSNALDSEIMSVTAIAHSSGNIAMTVTRAQRGTTAKAFNANAIVTNAIYADDAVFLGPNGTTESPSPWIKTGDIENGAVTAVKLASGAVTNEKMANGAASDNALNVLIGNNVDLNTIIRSGFYRFYAPYSNSPVNDAVNTYCSMIVISYSDDYRCTQIFLPNPEGNGSMFVRNSYYNSLNNTREWTSWKTISGGNDGTMPLSWAFIPATGYTYQFGYAFLKANTLFINFGLHKDSGNIGADEVIGKMGEWAAPVQAIYGGAWLSNNSIWTTNDVGYLYIAGKDAANPSSIGEVVVTDSSASHSYVKVCLWIPLGS